MSEKQESGTLHVGLLTPNRRYLVSPETHPALFQFGLDTYKNMSIEAQAKLLIDIEQHLQTSSISMLMPDREHQQDRGYLLGLVKPIDTREYGFRTFNAKQVEHYASRTQTVQGAMARQIFRYMS